jgi:hypothetical protein
MSVAGITPGLLSLSSDGTEEGKALFLACKVNIKPTKVIPQLHMRVVP